MRFNKYKDLRLSPEEKLLYESWQDSGYVPTKIAERGKIILLKSEGKSVPEIEKICKLSRSNIYKWLSRYKPQDHEWFLDHSRRPKCSPQKTPYEIETTILFVHTSLKKSGFQCGAKSIKHELERINLKKVPSIATINRILLKHSSHKNCPKSKKSKLKHEVSNQSRHKGLGTITNNRKRKCTFSISLKAEERKILESLKRSTMTKAGIAKRSEIILLLAQGKSAPEVAKILRVSKVMVYKWAKRFLVKRVEGLYRSKPKIKKKYENESIKSEVFTILHSPPSDYGINRSSWKLDDLKKCLSEKGVPISKGYIRKIIKSSGYSWRKARIVLTSPDPKYRNKLKKINDILSNLGPKEKFFSVDEYGPLSVKMRGGRALAHKKQIKTIPQNQKSKGSLICTASLELSTNQITHFYSNKKNTDEMIKLLNLLLKKHSDEECIYFSWDAASWHASKKLYTEVKRVNSNAYRNKCNTPAVELAPLPSGAQFLNVIESVFSGMARAIIHNSDYSSVGECKNAIDRYFEERNQYFKENPKKAGKKIWGKERVRAVFDESNNCKDPMYR